MNELVLQFGWPAAPTGGGEFPTVRFWGQMRRRDRQLRVRLTAWRTGAVDLSQLDAAAAALGEQGLAPVAAAGEPAARLELLTRYQRWLDRRNPASSGPGFAVVLSIHRHIHDRGIPRIRAAHDHALDAWQWVLRLDPLAGAAPQIAALFHDLGAEAVRQLLGGIHELAQELDRAAELVAAGDRPAGAWDRELELVQDADALSFFSLESGRILDDDGPLQLARAIGWNIPRLSPRGARHLSGIRLRPEVARLLPAGGAAVIPAETRVRSLAAR